MVDIIIEKDEKILLIKRKKGPFKGMLALPGGHIRAGETVEKAAMREAKEETSLHVKLLNIVGVYSNPKRDPRYPTISIAFIARVKKGKEKAGSDAKELLWMGLKEALKKKLAFDHKKILSDYAKIKNLSKNIFMLPSSSPVKDTTLSRLGRGFKSRWEHY